MISAIVLRCSRDAGDDGEDRGRSPVRDILERCDLGFFSVILWHFQRYLSSSPKVTSRQARTPCQSCSDNSPI